MIGLSFTFTNRGHGLYMCSPTEIQKISISADVKYVILETFQVLDNRKKDR